MSEIYKEQMMVCKIFSLGLGLGPGCHKVKLFSCVCNYWTFHFFYLVGQPLVWMWYEIFLLCKVHIFLSLANVSLVTGFDCGFKKKNGLNVMWNFSFVQSAYIPVTGEKLLAWSICSHLIVCSIFSSFNFLIWLLSDVWFTSGFLNEWLWE